jgi:hypothetical protein
VKANYRGLHATIKNDEWGFILANFQSMIPFSPESFVLPVLVEQVFYADAHGEPGWKIVLREVRGKRIFQTVGVPEASGIFALGQDVDHEGLCPPREVPKEDPRPSRTGRNLRRQEAFGPFQEEDVVFDRDVGGSGSSSEDDEVKGQD